MADSQKANPAEPVSQDVKTLLPETKSDHLKPASGFVRNKVSNLCCLVCYILPVAVGCLVFASISCMLRHWYIVEVEEDSNTVIYMLSWHKLYVGPLLFGLCNVEYQQRTLVLCFMTLVNSMGLLSVIEPCQVNDVAVIVIVIVFFRLASMYMNTPSSAWYRFLEGPPIAANVCMLAVNFYPKLIDCVLSTQAPDSSSWFS